MNDLGYKDVESYVRDLVFDELEKQSRNEDGRESPLEETVPDGPAAETDRRTHHNSR
jgi:hypothetical protein